MKITNRQNLPAALVAAITNDPYHDGGSDISVTRLIQPPRKVVLERQHADEIEEDASDRIWALLGQIGHLILERAAKGEIVEKRLSIERLGWKISGQADVINPDQLVDYKVTSAWSVKDGVKKEYVEQLNLLAYLAAMNGITLRSAQIVAILRDWSKLEAARNADYPKAQVQVFDVPLWNSNKQCAFLEARIRAHQAARNELPECTSEEMWERPTKFAVMKRGNVQAVKLFANHGEAIVMAAENKAYYVETRPGERPRCQHYCNAALFCSSYQQWKSLRSIDAESKTENASLSSVREN